MVWVKDGGWLPIPTLLPPILLSLRAFGAWVTRTLAWALDSLVRVTRRVVPSHPIDAGGRRVGDGVSGERRRSHGPWVATSPTSTPPPPAAHKKSSRRGFRREWGGRRDSAGVETPAYLAGDFLSPSGTHVDRLS